MTIRSTLAPSLVALLLPIVQFGLLPPAPAQAAVQEIRVAIKRDVSQVNIGSSVNAIVQDAAGKVVGEIKGMNGFVAQRTGGGVSLDQWKSAYLVVQPKDPDGVVWIGDRWYRGRVIVSPTGDGLTAVNWVDVEQYLYSVLGGEMNGNWHQEALKAQAVAARTYALHKQVSTRSDLYDVVDTTVSQVYRGIQDESTGTQMAVNGTKGQVLTNGGRLIDALFHSSAGGMTDNSGEVWSNQLPYLVAVPDFDQEAPVYQWKKRFSVAEINNLLGCGNGGTIKAFNPVKKTTGGRIKLMEVQSSNGNCRVDGETIQKRLDLKSTKFAIVPVYNDPPVASKDNKPVAGKPVTSTSKDNKPVVKDTPKPLSKEMTGFEVNGNGFGHGLGLSQYGALGMAKKGYNYQDIVLHYYNGKAGTKLAVLQSQ
jgi:stage II sporulation protein D